MTTRGLAMASHPVPTLAVTGFATACAVVLGGSWAAALLVAVAALTGQLCVGWSNDARDAARDTAAGRPDKPITQGMVSRAAVTAAAVLAGLACVPSSLALGVTAGGLHLLAVGSALAYNLVLKVGPLSLLPYAVSFGLFPVVVHFAVLGVGPPSGQVLGAGLLGAAAHFGNTVGDARADELTGVRGLPQRLGPTRSLVAMAALVAAAGGVLLGQILSGPGSAAALWGASLLVVGAAGAGGLALAGLRGVAVLDGHRAWNATLAAVALVVAGFLVSLAAA